MPENKSQHFVPNLYLKLFSTDIDKKTIQIFNISNENFFHNVKIKNEACKDYFYGKDLFIERSLKKIEDNASPIIHQIMKDESIPPRSSTKYNTLLTFIFFLKARTSYAGEEINESIDGIFKSIYSDVPDSNVNMEEYRLRYENPANVSLAHTSIAIPLLYDLNCKLVKNNSSIRFITSDNPVVFYNQQMELLKPIGSSTGLASKGLQVFIPISPNYCIIYYDPQVYKIGSKNSSLVEFSNNKDVLQLNKLQYINAHKKIYYSSLTNELDIRTIISKKRRSKIKVSFSTYENVPRDKKLLAMSKIDIKINLNLSIIKLLKKAKNYKLGNKVCHFRNENLYRSHFEFIGVVNQGKYKPSEFYKFLYDKFN